MVFLLAPWQDQIHQELLFHFSTLAVSQLVCKVSIDLLTLAGLSTNISTDRPANPGWCTVSLQTCRPWQVYGQFSDRVDLMSQTC